MRRKQHLEIENHFRASYPPDPQDDAFFTPTPPPQEENDAFFFEQDASTAPYPDLAYAQEEQEEEVYYPPMPVPSYQPPAHPSQHSGRRRRTPWAFIGLLSAAVFMLLLYGVRELYKPYDAFRDMVQEVHSQTFAHGVYVDGVSLGGMTRSQAENALQQHMAQSSQKLGIDVQVDHYAWRITESDIPFQRNISAVLDKAYAIGRQNSTQTLSGNTTPLEYRYQHRMRAAQSGAYFYTEVTYDKGHVRNFVENVASYVNRSAVDSQIATFDFATRTFTFTDEAQGAQLDSERLYESIVSLLDSGNFNAAINLETQVLTPNVTKVELMNSFSLISSFSTETTSDANRNNNIDLACRAVSGTVLMPGSSFSFNQATGQRTREKGYLPAAAIAGGTTIDEVGGGVCQVSSTLFNAAAMANMTITNRSPHTWPSNYVDKGRDATVNWPNLDFEFRNDSDAPIFILAHYANRVCTVEIYGYTLGAGVSIQLETDVTSTTPPPAEPAYTQNPALAPGSTKVLKKARTGYTVDTYRIFLRNGQEYKRELLCTSTYRMIQEVIEYN